MVVWLACSTLMALQISGHLISEGLQPWLHQQGRVLQSLYLDFEVVELQLYCTHLRLRPCKCRCYLLGHCLCCPLPHHVQQGLRDGG